MEINDLRFCAKYAFTEKAKDYLTSLKIDFSKVDDSLLDFSVQRIAECLRKDFSPNEKLREINVSKEPFLKNSIISYPVSKILACLNENRVVLRNYAYAESRKVYHFLQSDEEEKAFKIASEFFPVKKENGKYLMPFNEYLAYLPRGKEYDLVNQEMDKGMVFLDKVKLCRLVSEHVFQSILKTKVDRKIIPKIFIFFSEQIPSAKIRVEEPEIGEVDTAFFPPCIKSICLDLQSSEKVGHIPRFVLATFFANIGLEIEKAVDIFRTQPNFNEKKTRYYLEHAYGVRTKRKYAVPACSKIESYGVCRRNETCKWRHPLTYYKRMKAVKGKK